MNLVQKQRIWWKNVEIARNKIEFRRGKRPNASTVLLFGKKWILAEEKNKISVKKIEFGSKIELGGKNRIWRKNIEFPVLTF